MDNVREKLVEQLLECDSKFDVIACYDEQTISNSASILADHLLANGVTVQEAAYWKDVMQINGECFAYCSNCLTEHKAQNYAAIAVQHRFCRWCGARMVHQPPKQEG